MTFDCKWEAIEMGVIAAMVELLRGAGMANKYLYLMVPKEMTGATNTPGRPSEYFTLPTIKQKLHILEFLYKGADIIEISRVAKVNINSVAAFLFSDGSEACAFGYGKCSRCGKAYVWLFHKQCTYCHRPENGEKAYSKVVGYSLTGNIPCRSTLNGSQFGHTVAKTQATMMYRRIYLKKLEEAVVEVKKSKDPFGMWLKNKMV